MPDHVYALPPGHMLREYRIDRVLGSGGFGITYYAWDTHLDKPVAIKEYLPGDFAVRDEAGTVQPKSSDHDADYRWGLARFLDEARTLARFEHPHVNKVHRYFPANGTAYMVLEYIDGETLSAVLWRDKRLAPGRLRRLLDELLSGLDEVHREGIVHRDVKPANIMLRRDGSAVLLDFGIARQVIGKHSGEITKAMTEGYAPIEQYSTRADTTGPWTDLYALGMVAYRCVSGVGAGGLPTAPERSEWRRKGEREKDLKPAVEVGKGAYDERLLKAVDHAIEVYENERPQSVAEMREVLGVAPFLSAESKRLGERFLGRDFSPNAKDENGWTDLHYAAVGNWVEVAEFLVDAGADVDARLCGDGEMITNALANVLSRTTNLDLSSWTRQAETPLHIAAWANADKIAALWLKNGADIEAKNATGATPLHWAAWKNADKVAALLLKNGADIEAKNATGATPLHWAAGENADKTVDLLLKAGADIEAKNTAGTTPLHWAAWRNADKTVDLLLKAGADIEAKNANGDTPLHRAAWANADKVAALLLENGADIDAGDADGDTPLHSAAWANADKTAALLLKNGADIEAKGKAHYTPLHWAALTNADKTATLLLKAGANRYAQNQGGKTPLDVAMCQNSDKVLHLIQN